MSEAKGQHEPSMEEILASIRRIIAEDGDGGAAPGTAAPAAAPTLSAPSSAPRPEPQRPDEILELTDMVEEDGSVVSVNAKAPARLSEPELGFGLEPAPSPARMRDPEPEEPPLLLHASEDHRLVSAATAAASISALAQLAGASPRERSGDIPLGAAGRTLEDIVHELLRPLLKSWLDDNLPQLVERLVQEEIARMVRQAQGR